MALTYAVRHLTAAVNTLARTDAGLSDRLQRTWTDHVQELWQTMCLPADLNGRFRAMWPKYTQQSADDPHTSKLRAMTDAEREEMAIEIVTLALDTIAADARGAEPASKPH